VAFLNIFREAEKRRARDRDRGALTIRLDSGAYRSYSFGQLFDLVGKYAAVLEEAGLARGGRVAFIGENSPEWIIALLLIFKPDCTAVLIDPSLPDSSVFDFIERSDPRCIMASVKAAEKRHTDPPVFDIRGGAFMGENRPDFRKTYRPTPDGDPELAAIMFSSAASENLLAALREFKPTGFAGVPRIFTEFKSRMLDTAAYFAGKGFVKRKLRWVSGISPSKTAEGYVGAARGILAPAYLLLLNGGLL
jgi:long-subunit acyl-CoA synthetase (AMP-forming)